MEEKLYTVNEISNILKLNPLTIRLWLKNEVLGGIKAGRHWRIRERDLKEFYERGTSGRKKRQKVKNKNTDS